MFCVHCGKEVPEDAKFCSACGSPLSGGEMRQPAGKAAGIRVGKLTPRALTIHGLQALAVVLALFFPVVQDYRVKISGIFRSWSYMDSHYNFEERWKALHGDLQLVAVLLLFLAVLLIGFALLRGKGKLCGICLTAVYALYGGLVLRMVENNYYSRPNYEDFGLTPEFWIGMAAMVLALILTILWSRKPSGSEQ